MQSCMRLNQSCAKHFRQISFGISSNAASNASRASSGELKRTPRILSFTFGNRKNRTAPNPGNKAGGEAVELSVFAWNLQFKPRCEHWCCRDATTVLWFRSLDASCSSFPALGECKQCNTTLHSLFFAFPVSQSRHGQQHRRRRPPFVFRCSDCECTFVVHFLRERPTNWTGAWFQGRIDKSMFHHQ